MTSDDKKSLKAVNIMPENNVSGYPLTQGSNGFNSKIEEWLIKHQMPLNSVGTIYGPSGHYKSFISLAIAASVVTGKALLGEFKVKNKGSVLYVAAEAPAGIKKRIAGYEKVHGVCLDKIALYSGSSVIRNDIEKERLIKTCKDAEKLTGEKVRLIIIDTLSQNFGNGDENGGGMAEFYTACNDIRDKAEATVLVVHHTGKDTSKGQRGNSSASANIDYEIALKDKAHDFNECFVTYESSKAKDSAASSSLVVQLNKHVFGLDEDNDEISTLVVVDAKTDTSTLNKPLSAKDQCYAVLIQLQQKQIIARQNNNGSLPPVLRSDWEEAFNKARPKANFRREVNKLTQEQKVMQISQGKTTAYFHMQ